MLTLVFLFVLLVQVSGEEPELEPLPDYYAMLNVSHVADMKEIKRSFRKLAMEYHPDKNKSKQAQIIFQELSEAYSVLSNPQKKSEYDHLFNIFFDLSEDEVQDFESPDTHDDPKTEREEASEDADKQESSEESEEPVKDENTNSEEKSDDTSDLDDETLYKVLKFLADNDYVITKRTRKVPASPKSDSSEKFEKSDGSKSGADGSFQHTRYKRSAGAEEYARGSGHVNHQHPWTSNHSHKPRFTQGSAEYGTKLPGSDQVYCQSTTRWEGTVKITSRTCF